MVASWSEVVQQAPEVATRARERFAAHPHAVLATIRADGSPRLCGTELTFRDGELWLAGMAGARRFDDLRRDPRLALHSSSDDPEAWRGDARLAGRATPVDEERRRRFDAALQEQPPGPYELVRVEIDEVVTVALGEPADHLSIESWHERRGVRTYRR